MAPVGVLASRPGQLETIPTVHLSREVSILEHVPCDGALRWMVAAPPVGHQLHPTSPANNATAASASTVTTTASRSLLITEGLITRRLRHVPVLMRCLSTGTLNGLPTWSKQPRSRGRRWKCVRVDVGAAQRGLVGEFQGCQGGAGDGGQDVAVPEMAGA